MTNEYNQCISLLREVNIITPRNQINKQANRMLHQRFPLILKQVNELTSFLQYDADCRDRLFCIMNGITSQPTCEVCGKLTKFNKQTNQFNRFCSNKRGSSCSMSSLATRNKIKSTNLDKYGTPNPQQNDDIKNKRQQTMLDRYGVESPAQLDANKNKLRDYVVAHQTEVAEKREQTMTNKFGRSYYAQTQLSDRAYATLSNPTALTNMLKDLSKTDLATHLGVTYNVVHDACVRHHIEYIPTKKPGSSQQQSLLSFILRNYDGEIIQDAKGVIPMYDLDIYLPKLKLAIEFNGIYFHGESKNRGKKYHITKLQLCENAGIRLIQVWSNEWLEKKDIVKSRVMSALHNSTRIYARQCTITQVQSSEERNFMVTSHIQRYVPSVVNYALKYDGIIVAMMTFTKSRFNKQHEWELLRYTNALDCTVVGGASKLFKHFITQHNPTSVISYCDLRWGTGNLYKQLGFTKQSRSVPNYFYFKTNGDTNKLYSRQCFQKHKLVKVLSSFDPNKTEWENMVMNGYDRIWDCGNDVYVWINPIT